MSELLLRIGATKLAVSVVLAAVVWVVHRRVGRPAVSHSLWVVVLVTLLVPAVVSLPVLPAEPDLGVVTPDIGSAHAVLAEGTSDPSPKQPLGAFAGPGLAIAWLLGTIGLVGWSPVRPQEVTVLTENPCASCSLEITPDVLLGADGESVIGSAWDIQRLSDGRFTMAFQNVSAWAEFTIFSADGSAFRRVGREGEGPGEYGHVVWVREHGEELYVFDNQRRRMGPVEVRPRFV